MIPAVLTTPFINPSQVTAVWVPSTSMRWMMQFLRCRDVQRCVRFLVLTVTVCTLPSIAVSAPILTSFKATLKEPGFPAENDENVAVQAGAEITRFNGTNVGALFFDDESIDVTSDASTTTFLYTIQGGAGPHPIAPGFSLTGWSAGTFLKFSHFVLSQPGTLAAVLVSPTNVVGEAGAALVPGTDYGFDAKSLTIFLAGLGVLEQQGQLPLGSMTFSLTFRERTPVPEPGVVALMGLGLAAAVRRRRGVMKTD
jgi:hypothetical protein